MLSSDHMHMSVSVPHKIAISDLVRKVKGRLSHKAHRELPATRRRYCGSRFWGRGYFYTANGAITEGIVQQHLGNHIADPNDVSRYLFSEARISESKTTQSSSACPQSH